MKSKIKTFLKDNLRYGKKNWYLYPLSILFDILFVYLFFFTVFFSYELKISEKISDIAERAYDNIGDFQNIENIKESIQTPQDLSTIVAEEEALMEEVNKVASLAFQMFLLLLLVFIVFQGFLFSFFNKKIRHIKIWFSWLLFAILSLILFLGIILFIYLTVRWTYANNISQIIRLPQFFINIFFVLFLVILGYIWFSWINSINIIRESFFKGFLVAPVHRIKDYGLSYILSLGIIIAGIIIYVGLFNIGLFFISLWFAILILFPMIAFVRIAIFRHLASDK
jgi:hypothetical protein